MYIDVLEKCASFFGPPCIWQMIRVTFGMQVAKTPTIMSFADFRFLLHYVITIH